MKEEYQKPEVYSDDISVAFSGACCTEESPVGAIPGSFIPAACLPSCKYQLNSYTA